MRLAYSHVTDFQTGKTIKNNDFELHCIFFSDLYTHRVRKRRTLCFSKLKCEYIFLFKYYSGRENILLGLKILANRYNYEGIFNERFHRAFLQLTKYAAKS